MRIVVSLGTGTRLCDGRVDRDLVDGRRPATGVALASYGPAGATAGAG